MHEPPDAVEQQFPWRCVTEHDREQVEPWLEANIGKFDRDWYRLGLDIAAGVMGWEMFDIYRFRDEQSAIMFRLRWS